MTLRTARRDLLLINELLTNAETEARLGGDDTPGAEHLLLAALTSADTSAHDAVRLEGHTLDRATLRSALSDLHNEALASVGVVAPELEAALPPATGIYTSQTSAQEVFQRARALSKRSPSGLRSAHVLLAVSEREHGTAARLLRRLGVERASVADAVARVLAS